MNTHYERIVVPLDGSKAAGTAVPHAATLSRLLSVPLAFVHVAAGERGGTVVDREERQANFKSYALPLGVGAFGESTAQVLEGAPAQRILEFAGDSSVIVLSSHGRGGWRAVLIGSVADKVVRGATAPVLVVPAMEAASDIAVGPLMVALDGSTQAEAGLALGRELATSTGAKLVLVRGYDLTPPPSMAEFGFYVAEIADEAEQGARAYLKSTARPGESAVIARGPADLVIVEAATSSNASLVIMTTEGMGRARRLALGSTTDRVLHSLKRPLLVIPPRE